MREVGEGYRTPAAARRGVSRSVPITGVCWARFSIRSTPGAATKALSASERMAWADSGQIPTTRP